MTSPQFIFLVVMFVFLVAVVIVNGVRNEKEVAKIKWKEKFKNTPYDDPSRVALRNAGYSVD
jgi:hypothetical protein